MNNVHCDKTNGTLAPASRKELSRQTMNDEGSKLPQLASCTGPSQRLKEALALKAHHLATSGARNKGKPYSV